MSNETGGGSAGGSGIVIIRYTPPPSTNITLLSRAFTATRHQRCSPARHSGGIGIGVHIKYGHHGVSLSRRRHYMGDQLLVMMGASTGRRHYSVRRFWHRYIRPAKRHLHEVPYHHRKLEGHHYIWSSLPVRSCCRPLCRQTHSLKRPHRLWRQHLQLNSDKTTFGGPISSTSGNFIIGSIRRPTTSFLIRTEGMSEWARPRPATTLAVAGSGYLLAGAEWGRLK